MRLKQFLGVGLSVLVLSTLAAADSQLTEIGVQGKANTSTVTIRANSSLIHNEYRPADNLLLVDFPGVSVGKLDAATHNVSAPGVASYQVHSYKAANGSDIARVELTLAPHTSVRLKDGRDTVEVTVTADGAVASTTAPTPIAAAPITTASLKENAPSTPELKPASLPVVSSTARPLMVRGVSVVRGRDGMNVEIRANGSLTPRILKLKNPDRLVIDLVNAIPESRPHEIPVHAADVTDIRMSQFQAAPPTTRVVVDLTKPEDYDLSNGPGMLIVKLRSTASAPAATPADAGVAVAGVETASVPKIGASAALAAVASTSPVREPVKAAPGTTTTAASSQKDFVVVQPTYHAVAADAQHDSLVSTTATERAAQAAHTLGAIPPVEIPLSSMPVGASMKPETMNAAMAQAAAAPSQTNMQAVTAANSTSACNTGRYTGEPISVNLKDVDLKDFFRLIHEISGLNVVLDPGVNGSLTIVLDDVPWDQALAIVLQNNSLQCQLSGNVLRIALPDTLKKEADAIRTTQEAQALAVDRVTVTRYLSYASSKAVVPTLKAFLSKRGDIISDDRTNAVIIQDIPTVIPGIDRLIKELDRKTQEVEIEARVVAATRTFARDLGTQFGFGVANGSSAVGGATAVGTSPTQVTSGGKPINNGLIQVGTGQIPLFSNLAAGPGPTSGLTLLTMGHNYRIDTILTAAESRGLLKILSRPRVVTQNNIQALVRQGVRIPVVTAAQLGGPPTTSYVDAFLRLQVQPQITAEGTIFLNVDVENTTPDFSQEVQGNPTLITQQATTQVLVADGGTVVIGGVIQTNDTINYQQVPFLGNIPVFGNLFKRKSVSTSTQELIFFITPRIVQT